MNIRKMIQLVENARSEFAETENGKIDTLVVDVPLFIKLLEFSREEAKTDVQLHEVTERMLEAMEKSDVLTMEQYSFIVGE